MDSVSNHDEEGRCELDSHADTTVAGANMRVMETTNETVEARPFANECKSLKQIPIAACGTAYDCPHTGTTWLLAFGQALCFGKRMNHSLMCPNQVRSCGSLVHDTPKQFDKSSRHSTVIRDTEINQQLEIPLQMDGVISHFHARLPTDDEMESAPRLMVTDPDSWEPHSKRFQEQEEIATETFEDNSMHLPDDDSRQLSAAAVEPHNVDAHEPCEFRDDTFERLVAANSTCRNPHDHKDHPHSGDSRRISATLKENGFCCHANASMLFGDKCCECGIEQDRNIAAAETANKSNVATAEQVSKMWKVGLETARQTIKVSAQRGLRKAHHPVRSRFKSQPWMRKPLLPGKWYGDTALFKVKSLQSDTCAQVTTNGCGYGRFAPLKSKKTASDGLVDLINNVGMPQELITDGSKEQGTRDAWGTNWAKVVKKYHIKQSFTHPCSFWQNKAEQEIREIKRGIKKFARSAQSPRRLWNFLGEHVTNLRSRTALKMSELEGRTPFEKIHAHPPELAPCVSFEWYQWVCYLDENRETRLARWMGPAENYGSGDAHWMLPTSCKPMVRSTVWAVPNDELENDVIKEAERAHFDQQVLQKIGDHVPTTEEHPIHFTDYGDLFEEESDPAEEPIEPAARVRNADEHAPEACDQYLSAEVLLPTDGEYRNGTVKRRVTDDDGNPVGIAHKNPLLDTREHEVSFPDGSTEAFSANLIAENLCSQIDDEGKQHALIDEISDHRKTSDAVSIEEGWENTKNGQKRRKRATKGWELLVSWKDGTSTWMPLSDMKESCPVETAEHAVGNMLTEEPAFAWWSRHALRKRDRIASKAKTKHWKRTHKCGIRLPKTVEEALEIDRETGTDFWRKAIEKEMRNARVAFEFSEDDTVPIGHKEINCHMVFDAKITLDRKARFVANGNELEDSAPENTFSSVVSRDSVRTFFALAALNDLEVLSADVQNACLAAPIKEKCWYRTGLEFGQADANRPVKIVRALCGLKIAGFSFRSHLARTLREMGFKSCKADPDVWYRPARKPDGTKCYEHMLACVDDLLGASHNIKKVFDELGKRFKFKPESIKEPDSHLGADISKWTIEDSEDPGKTRWAMSSTKHTKKATAEVENELKKVGRALPKKVKTPLSTDYRPEIDATPELDPKRLNCYQGLTGALRWTCELGRIDMLVPVSMLSRYLVSAREGHLQQVFHIFSCLKSHERSALVFDDTEPTFDGRRFTHRDWSEHCPEAEDELPQDMPEPRGKAVSMSCFVDADHAGCHATRRSHAGVLIFVNRAPILWCSKRQNTVETSTFGSEIVAMKIAVEMIEGLRCKLRMMGVPLEGPTNVFCDNDSVVKNTTRPESTLKKKSNAAAYHKAREAQASGKMRITKEDGETNLSDILTKLLPGPRLRALISRTSW